MTRDYKPELILMDIKMPEMDGIEATKIIKADNELKNIPVIAVTASSIQTEDNLLKMSIFDEYITKPIKFPLLLRSMSHFLNT